MNAVQTASVPLSGVDMGGSGGQSPVLRVIVENLFYPVTLEVLHQVTTSLPLRFTLTTHTRLLSLCLHVGADLLEVWDGAEDHHIYQKQSVPGSGSVLGHRDGSALQAGE